MRLYRTAEGLYVGTQAEAGKGFEQVEVPAVKPDLIAWLNLNTTITADQAADLAFGPVPDTGRCALCSRDHKTSERAAQKLADGCTADALAQMIETKPGFFVARVADAVIARLEALKGEG